MSLVDTIARDTPLWVLGLGSLIAMIAARELGAAAHRGLHAAADGRERKSGDEGHILAAVLGLLGLLVAFTFSLALDRHDTRRALVVAEANDLGTAYLRTALLDNPDALRADLRSYTRERLAYGLSTGGAQEAAARRADALQAAVWRDAMDAVKPFRATTLVGAVTGPINDAFDTAAKRKAALAARLPGAVLGALALYAVIAAGMLGYTVEGAGGRHRVASLLMFLLLALAISLILDLDRPRSGAIEVSQTPMADALAAMGP